MERKGCEKQHMNEERKVEIQKKEQEKNAPESYLNGGSYVGVERNRPPAEDD